ncbi:DUF4190 domain-containing protein [Streptomyces sp. NPDC058691]|uniref:DUF4190 domain-containing protein n=1 Tax=Streptomyces sp. NPDC058691 TaxID=3346601 RepID=UPI003662E3C3
MESPTPASPPEPSRPAVSKLAVAALVSGLLCGVPVVGVVLGAMALGRIEKTGQRGKSMAKTGLLLSALSTLACGVVLAFGLAGFTKGLGADIREGALNDNAFALLREGECIDTPGDELGSEFPALAIVPCAGKHTAEVFGVFQFAGDGGYPGEESIDKTVDSRCTDLDSAYSMDDWAASAEVVMTFYSPSRERWEIGDRRVTCLYSRTGNTPLEGSLRQDETTLDEHQVVYLKAADIANDARYFDKPEAEYVKDDFKGYKEWAHDVAVALDEQSRILRGHEWPAAAEPHVAALRREIDAARPHWAMAAGAKDTGAYYDHYEAALHRPGHDQAIKARAALGLATNEMPESFV